MDWLKKAFGYTTNDILSDLSSDEDLEEFFENVIPPGGPERQESNAKMDNHMGVHSLIPPTVETNNSERPVEMQTDAILRNINGGSVVYESLNLDIGERLTLSNVIEIEKCLEEYEIVSLVYLLYDNAELALQEICLYLQNPSKQLIYSWAISENSKGHKTWPLILAEALCIIQNYAVLKKIGYKKEDAKVRFLPAIPSTVINIPKFRKTLYIICDNMNQDETATFLNLVKNSFQEKKLVFKEFDSTYLETYFLYWETMKYITPNNITTIQKSFKVMEKEMFNDWLQTIQSQPEIEIEETPSSEHKQLSDKIPQKERMPSTSCDTHFRTEPSTSSLFSLESSLLSYNGRDNNISHFELPDDNRYPIDPNNPGVVLIINQSDFYTEINPIYKDLLPPSNDQLEQRTGTKKDKEALRILFVKFGFKVVIENNLCHIEMLQRISEITASVKDESSLFVIILTHGDKGVVYGANSCKVEVGAIQKVMCKTNKNLNGRPKILILQSCQGTDCQKILEEQDEELEIETEQQLTTDGGSGSKLVVPGAADILTFWATVPGYAAIRNKRTGSWFIQAFCEKVKNNYERCHLVDICTRVINQVTNKTWKRENKINVMTPIFHSAFRYDFYFPPLKKLELMNEMF